MKAFHASVAIVLGLGLLAGCGSCSGRGSAPRVVESWSGGAYRDVKAWKSLPALPAWVKAPPVREGFLVFVTGPVLSDLPHIAAFKAEAPDVRAFVRERLGPVVGEAAAAAAAQAAPAMPTPVEQACHESREDGDMTPGANLASVWSLFEVPTGPILDTVPADRRVAAQGALRQ